MPGPMTAIEARAEHFPHDADVGVCGVGPTREAAFQQAALALAAIAADLDAVRSDRRVAIECAAPTDALLLVDWLNAIIYHMAVDHLLFCRFDVRIDGEKLRARAWGEKIDKARHALGVEPKGATYTALKVERDAQGGWVAQCVIDV